MAALRGVSFEIKQGDFIIILGNSGGGKTSLLNILGTIDKQTKVIITFYLGESLTVRIKDKGENNRRNIVWLAVELFRLCVSNVQPDFITDCKTECRVANDPESNFHLTQGVTLTHSNLTKSRRTPLICRNGSPSETLSQPVVRRGTAKGYNRKGIG